MDVIHRVEIFDSLEVQDAGLETDRKSFCQDVLSGHDERVGLSEIKGQIQLRRVFAVQFSAASNVFGYHSMAVDLVGLKCMATDGVRVDGAEVPYHVANLGGETQ